MQIVSAYLKADRAERLSWLTLFTALAAALSITEKMLPLPLPWIKPGLANLITLVLLVVGQLRDALIVSLLRTFVTALFLGGLFAPGHLFALSGALVSCLGMALLFRSGWFGIYGISALGAWLHALTQLVCGALLFLSVESVAMIAPLLLFFSLAAGLLTAWVTVRLLRAGEEAA